MNVNIKTAVTKKQAARKKIAKVATPTEQAPAEKAPTKRQMNAIAVREKILNAAARVVGKYGYEGASVARITERAKVAHGTFYHHYASRQDMFDELLPAMGELMLAFIRDRVSIESLGAKREEERLRAYLEFLRQNTWYHRVLNEAEVMAPKAHKTYFARVSKSYVAALDRSLARGEIKAFDQSELEAVSYILMSMRLYIAQRYVSDSASGGLSDDVVQTFSKFVERALFR